ncbi:BTAD domain-containing putative transcriptional regulator [Actinoplanes sp. GCM10030250]|uniref:AfsR/SARP family transcriptional regulator n=1 Tax=Actinoplanes sp. GCM10030250 TaxID=3273376 RepID=UPI003610143D
MSVLTADAAPALSVLGGFQLCSGDTAVALPSNAQRVLGFLALNRTSHQRHVLAGRLWTNASQERAQANLRTAIWRVRQSVPGVVDCSRDSVRLCPAVTVDYRWMLAVAEQLFHRDLGPEQLRQVPCGLLASELLPGWDEDWLLIERERHRQLRMHALEALSTQLTDIAEYGLAVDCAYAAIGIEPLCESATHALLRACLAEGNRAEALRQFHRFRHLLDGETGLRPSPQLMDLMGGTLAGAGAAGKGSRRGP